MVKNKRPMKGFTKITFGDDGGGTAQACAKCGKTACFCVHDLQKAATAAVPPQKAATAALPPPSPAASVLSVRLNVDKSPTFTFQPWSGYGNTSPPDFSLGGPSSAAASPERAAADQPFFGGGSPTWLFDGWTFTLSDNGGAHRALELQKLIERHGGVVSETVHRKVDLVIATEKDVGRNGKAVRRARSKGVPLVPATFLHDSLAAGEACDFTWYIFPQTDAAAVAAASGFNWRRAISKQLRAAEGGELRRKHLRHAVLAQHRREQGAAAGCSLEMLRARFRRAMQKARAAGRLVTDGKQVRLP